MDNHYFDIRDTGGSHPTRGRNQEPPPPVEIQDDIEELTAGLRLRPFKLARTDVTDILRTLGSAHANSLSNRKIKAWKNEWTHNSGVQNFFAISHLIVAAICTGALFTGLHFFVTNLHVRRFLFGALGMYLASNFVKALKVGLWAAVNHLLTKGGGKGISFGDLSTAMSTAVQFDFQNPFKTGWIGLFSVLVLLLELALPSAVALIFSTGFETEVVTTGAVERAIEITEIGGCDSGQCIATSATLLGLLKWQINSGRHLDGASLSGGADATLFYPCIPTEAVDAYWSNSPHNSTVFSIASLPGLLVEATTSELSQYSAYTNEVATTTLNLSYEARVEDDQAFRMELIGQVESSAGRATFLFDATVRCATADTTITVQPGVLGIEAENLSFMNECIWDNSSLQMWRSFESSLGVAIRYDYNAWFSRLRNESTYSRYISELLGSVVGHKLSTGEATIKRVPGSYSAEVTHLRDRERVAAWMAYAAAACLAFILARVVLLFSPFDLLHAELRDYSHFMTTLRGPNCSRTDTVKAKYTNTVEVHNGESKLVGCLTGKTSRQAGDQQDERLEDLSVRSAHSHIFTLYTPATRDD